MRRSQGIKNRKARKYRIPANGSGGISFNPILINTQEVDQMTVTAMAIQIAERLESGFVGIDIVTLLLGVCL